MFNGFVEIRWIGGQNYSPARAAGSLVLDGADRVGSRPIDGSRDRDTLEGVDHARSLLAGGRLGEVHGLELLERKVGELVVAEGEGRVAGIVGVDEVRVGREDRKPLGKLRALEGQPVLLDVVDKLWILKEGGEGKGKEEGLQRRRKKWK